MKEDFDKLDSVEDMLSYLVENNPEEKFMPLTELNVQIFLTIYNRVKQLDPRKQEEINQCTKSYNNAMNNNVIKQSALTTACELLFPNPEEQESQTLYARKSEKASQTPCEDCQSTPSHLIQFRLDDRVEEHYLCVNCEKAIQTDE